MPLARTIIGTLAGIPRALGEAELDDLYEVAKALQNTREAVLDIALRKVACEEGYRIAAEYHRRAPSQPKQKGPQR